MSETTIVRTATLSTATAMHVFGRARLPTRDGLFEVVSFRRELGEPIDDVALIRGNLGDARDVPTRIHSECLTGDVFGSLRCDCRDQLELALDRLAQLDRGVLLYLRQEGRGIGIAHKVRAYHLQDQGFDTVEANEHLGFDDDLRNYEHAAGMLHALGIASVEVHTNNPKKIAGLRAYGIVVSKRVPLIVAPRDENRFYLATKRSKSGHIIEE